MRAQLMLTCLCDALYGEVGIATVRVLEACGVEVLFPEGQTCCGQPAFNSGDWSVAQEALRRFKEIFDPKIPVVTPSASCAAQLRHGAGLMNGSIGDIQVYELSEYLLDTLEVDVWPLRGGGSSKSKQVALHQSCHGRAIALGDRQRRLLSMIPGVTVVDPPQAEQCCGFGGSFSATHGTISSEIGIEKLRQLEATGCDVVASGDMGCLMHLMALAKRRGSTLRFAHFAELLAEALP